MICCRVLWVLTRSTSVVTPSLLSAANHSLRVFVGDIDLLYAACVGFVSQVMEYVLNISIAFAAVLLLCVAHVLRHVVNRRNASRVQPLHSADSDFSLAVPVIPSADSKVLAEKHVSPEPQPPLVQVLVGAGMTALHFFSAALTVRGIELLLCEPYESAYRLISEVDTVCDRRLWYFCLSLLTYCRPSFGQCLLAGML